MGTRQPYLRAQISRAEIDLKEAAINLQQASGRYNATKVRLNELQNELKAEIAKNNTEVL